MLEPPTKSIHQCAFIRWDSQHPNPSSPVPIALCPNRLIAKSLRISVKKINATFAEWCHWVSFAFHNIFKTCVNVLGATYWTLRCKLYKSFVKKKKKISIILLSASRHVWILRARPPWRRPRGRQQWYFTPATSRVYTRACSCVAQGEHASARARSDEFRSSAC